MVYSYEAKDRQGRTVTGSLDAADERTAAGQVREMGYFPMRVAALDSSGGRVAAPARPGAGRGEDVNAPWSAQVAAPVGPGGWLLRKFVYPLWTGIGVRDLALFYRQFGAMIHAGVPIYQCLATLQVQTPNGTLRRCLQQIAARVQAGGQLSDAMAEYPWIFTDFHRAMIIAGEVSGDLDTMLQRLSSALEQEWALRGNIKRETWYPLVVIHLAFLLPPIVLVIVQHDPRAYVHQAVLPLAELYGVVLALYVLTRLASQFKVAYDGFLSYLPAVGGTVRMIALARFCRALSSLYAAGVLLPRAVRVAAAASGNAFLGNKMVRAIPDLEAGQGVVEALGRTGAFPPMVVSMMGTGEQTGSLDQTMDRVAEFYEQESVVRLHQTCVTLGVIAMIIAGIRVAMVVIQFYTGYFKGLLDTPDQ